MKADGPAFRLSIFQGNEEKYACFVQIRTDLLLICHRIPSFRSLFYQYKEKGTQAQGEIKHFDEKILRKEIK